MRVARLLSGEAGFGDDAALLALVDRCETADADWLALVGPGENFRDEADELAAPAILAGFDAVFGALEVNGAPWRPSRLAFDVAERLPHALLNWWVGPPRFVRAPVLRRLLEAAPGEAAVDRLFRLWREARCIKLACALVQTAEAPAGLGEEERGRVLERLDAEPVFMPVLYDGRVYRMPYTGRNAGIERDHTRGVFFEAAELDYLRSRIAPGACVVDVGANTGNHTVFFAGPMRAQVVLPVEPMPAAAKALRRAVAANGLDNVDLVLVGTGAGALPGRMRAVASVRGGLGATRLEADATGDVAIHRLDDVLTMAPQFLKIDVEGMELDVLRGAQATIRKNRPLIFIEVANRNTGAFLDWMSAADYRIERIFSDKGHANYLIAPQGRSTRQKEA